jgi:hypothetical protein
VKVALESIEKGRGDKYCIGCGCSPVDLVSKRGSDLLENSFILFRLVGSVADNARLFVCVSESIYISTTMYPTGEHVGYRPEDICRGTFPVWLNGTITALIIEKVRLYVEVHTCLQPESRNVSHKLCLPSHSHLLYPKASTTRLLPNAC